MAHELFGEKFLARGEPGWHRLGTTFPADRKITLVEAAYESGIAYDTKMVPVYAVVGKDYIPVPDRMAIVREPQGDEVKWVPLDVVGKNYKLVTNLSICETFNEVSEIYPVETIGALGRGERMFAALDAGEVDIKGDHLHQYFTLYDEKTGRSSTKIYYTPVRTVCANTLRMGIAEATLTMNVAHTRGNIRKMEKLANLVIDMNKRVGLINGLFINMAETPFSLDEFRVAVAYIYPEPIPPEKSNSAINVGEEFEKLRQDRLAHQEAAVEIYQKWNDEQPKLANTEWGAWNSIVELEDWKAGRGKGQFTSALFGERAQTKQLALSVIHDHKTK